MKIGILLPADLDLGLIRRARQLSLMIGEIVNPGKDRWSATIGLPKESEDEWRTIERALRHGNQETVVRHLRWEALPTANARRMFAGLSPTLDLEGIETVKVARDWGWNFQDCDAVIVFADPGLGAILPLVPTIFYCTDLAVRIAPKSWARSIDDPYWGRQTDAFRIWRQSSVLTSDDATVEDILSYAGVRRERIFLVSNLLDHDVDEEPTQLKRQTKLLAWFIGPEALHDLENAAIGLQIYLSEGGVLDPVLVRDGVRNARVDDPAIYLESLPPNIADIIYGLPSRRISSERELHRFLSQAAALWSSRVAGGEGEMLLLASQAGIPVLGADFGINRKTAEAAQAKATLYELGDPLAIADSLHEIEEQVRARVSAQKAPRTTRQNKAKALRVVLQHSIEAGRDH